MLSGYATARLIQQTAVWSSHSAWRSRANKRWEKKVGKADTGKHLPAGAESSPRVADCARWRECRGAPRSWVWGDPGEIVMGRALMTTMSWFGAQHRACATACAWARTGRRPAPRAVLRMRRLCWTISGASRRWSARRLKGASRPRKSARRSRRSCPSSRRASRLPSVGSPRTLAPVALVRRPPRHPRAYSPLCLAGLVPRQEGSLSRLRSAGVARRRRGRTTSRMRLFRASCRPLHRQPAGQYNLRSA